MKTLTSYSNGKTWAETPSITNNISLSEQVADSLCRYVENFGKEPSEIILTQYAADKLGFEISGYDIYGFSHALCTGMVFMGMRIKIEPMSGMGIFRLQ